MNAFKIEPQDNLPDEILKQLNAANASYTQTKDFQAYKDRIKTIFQLTEPNVTDDAKRYLAGFIEGEGSLNVSIKKLSTAKFGVLLDPEFSITQHVNGVSNLYLAMCVFQTGRISKKSGSKATLVYRIDNRQSISEKVLTFFDKFVSPFGSPNKKERKALFSQLLCCFEEKKHLNLESFIKEMLPLWDTLRVQKRHSNESFESLDDAVAYILEFIDNKEKER